jgi:hypothetical protein
MAALLYQGDLINARNLWRRCCRISSCDGSEDTMSAMTSPLLVDWWQVGRAMIEWDAKALWPALQHIETSHPVPINQYAQSVATAFRLRLLHRVVVGYNYNHLQSLPMAPFLNFNSTVELQDFCQQNGYDLMESNEGISIVQKKKQPLVPKSSPASSSAVNGIMSSSNSMVDPRSSIVQIITCLESSTMTHASPQPNNSGSIRSAAPTVALPSAGA